MKKMLKASKVVILAILALTVFFIIQLKNLRMENDIREYMPHESGSYQRLLETEDVFGSTVVTGISLETSDPTIFTADNIKKIDSITKRMENVENVSDVQSLTNIDYLKDDNGTLVAGPLLDEDFTGTDAEVENVRDKVADWSELYDRVIISDNDAIYGLETRKGTDFIVTSGISGWAIPFKTGTISEYCIIDVSE